MRFLNWKKYIAAGLITAQLTVFMLFPAQTAYALDGGAGWVNVARELADVVGKTVARQLMVQMLNSLVDKVKTLGRDGGPAFVRDWQAFKAEGQYRGEDKFRAILANTKVCDHLRQGADAGFNVNPKFKETKLTGVRTRVENLQPFTLRARCTLPSGFDLAAYRNSPSQNGGWEAFLRLLEPQNNDLGLGLMAAQELGLQRSSEETADENEATSGGGYTSAREACEELGGGARCVTLEKIGTPGDLLGRTSQLSIENLLNFVTDTDELTDSIVLNAVAGAIATTIVNRITNLAESDDDEFTQPSTREQRANEYCTLISPRDDVEEEFQPLFDLAPFRKGPCPEPAKDNLGFVHVCVQRCMQALGLIDDNIELDNTNSPLEIAATPIPSP